MSTNIVLSQMDSSEKQRLKLLNKEEALSKCNDKQKEYISKAPDSNQRVLADAFGGKSLVKAIKAKCLSCCNFSKEDIQYCAVEICPLYSVRPFRKKSKDDSVEDEDQDE